MPYRIKATPHRSANAKPLSEINLLLNQLNAHPATKDVQDKEALRLITPTGPQCYLLLKGYVTLFRENDRLTLNTECAPFVFGFSSLQPSTASLAIQLSSDAVVRQLPRQLAWEAIKESGSWDALSRLLMYVSARIFDHCARLSQLSSYQTVRHLLWELAAEPEAVRKQVSVVYYIQSRSVISRSRIMQILAELRAGNYITLAKGKLLAVHHLPEKF